MTTRNGPILLKSELSSADSPATAARLAASLLRLPLQAGTRNTGDLTAAGMGSSLDFKDHRPYLPGDDPRYINWQAYARTGTYTLKVFHQEASPAVDLLLDGSRSMTFDLEKKQRVLELFHFCLECAGRSSAALRVFVAEGGTIRPLAPDALLSGKSPFADTPPAANALALGSVPWRAGSVRVVISDLLFPRDQPGVFFPLGRDRGRPVVLVPFCKGESDPDWSGQIEFIDCETTESRTQKVSESHLEKYRRIYREHFELWREAARQSGAPLARVGATGDLVEALKVEALPRGAVELRS